MCDFKSHLAGGFQKVLELEHFGRVGGAGIWLIAALRHERRTANILLSKRTNVCAIVHHGHCFSLSQPHRSRPSLSSFSIEMFVPIGNGVYHVEEKPLVVKTAEGFLFQI